MDDAYIAYDTAAPQWQDLDALVLEHLDLPADNYRLTGSEWTSGWVLDEDGRAVRYGVLYGEMYAARWESTYQAQTEIPLFAATAIYAMTEAGALIVADYAPLPMIVVLAAASVGVLLVALGVIVFLLLLRRKRKEDEEDAQHNPVN